MDRIATQIERLKSPNKNKRYDACEELRVSDSLPDEALKALEKATHDPDRWVADAAKDALTFHAQTAPANPLQSIPARPPEPFRGNRSRSLVGLLAGGLGGLLLVLLAELARTMATKDNAIWAEVLADRAAKLAVISLVGLVAGLVGTDVMLRRPRSVGRPRIYFRDVMATICLVLASYFAASAGWITGGLSGLFDSLVDLELASIVAGLSLVGGRQYARIVIILLLIITIWLLSWGFWGTFLVFLIPPLLSLALATLVYRHRPKQSASGGTLT